MSLVVKNVQILRRYRLQVSCTVNDPIALQEWLSESMVGEFEIENWDKLIDAYVKGENFKRKIEVKPAYRNSYMISPAGNLVLTKVPIRPVEPNWHAVILLKREADLAIFKMRWG